MFKQFWRRGKKQTVSHSHSNHFYLSPLVSITFIAVTAIFAVVTLNGYGFHMFVHLQNGTTVFWQLEPLKR
jgi:hypothetical protein